MVGMTLNGHSSHRQYAASPQSFWSVVPVTASAFYYAALLPRRGRILRRTLSVRLSVRPVIVTERHVAPPSELQ